MSDDSASDDDMSVGEQEKKTGRKKQKTGHATDDSSESVISSYLIDPDEMLRLKQEYDADVEIQTCRERKKIETFRHKCSVAWWFMHDAVQLQTLPYFDQETYMRKLQDVLTTAQDYLNLFRFVAFYFIKDMVAWVLRADGSLPFGVVELGINKTDIPGTFYSVRREGHFEREVVYECTDQTIANRYNFYVFEQGPVFKTSDRTYGGATTNVMPVSAFGELFEDKYEIKEARVCLGDANFMSSHPEGFIYSKPLPDTNIENIPEETRYIENDLAAASQATSLHRANLTSALAGQYVNRFKQTSASLTSRGFGTSIAQDKMMMQQMFYQHGGCGVPGSGATGRDVVATLYHERQAEFMRPTVKESLEELPSYMEVSRGPAPAILMQPGDLQRRYDDKVCQLMNFPHIFFKPHGANPGGRSSSNNSTSSGTSSNNTNAGNLLFAQRQLDDAVVQQQSVFQQIFSELYKRTFGVMDQLLFELLPPEWRLITEHISARMLFDNQITKSDDAIHGLLPFFKEGIVSEDDIRKLLERNFGLLTKEEQKKRMEGEMGATSVTNDNKKKDKSTKTSIKKKEKEKKKGSKKGTESEDEGSSKDDNNNKDKKDNKKEKSDKEASPEEEKEASQGEEKKEENDEKKKKKTENKDEKGKKEKKRKADEIEQ